MLKIVFILAAIIILAFILLAMMCAMIVAGRSDAQTDEKNTQEADEELLLKKKICSRCKTGEYTYELDPKSEVCPYIGCWKRNKCQFYKPLDMPSTQENKNE